MKDFDINLAKQGKPVCTRSGRPVRILCFDLKTKTKEYPIVAAIAYDEKEIIEQYAADGKYRKYMDSSDFDLMMVGEKKEGWINLYSRNGKIYNTCAVYETRDEALVHKPVGHVDTVKIKWEE